MDESGGPNNAFAGLGVTDASIILNSDMTKMYKQPMFHVFAHFSKFISADSIRIDNKLYGISSSDIEATAFLRPDNRCVVILHNIAGKLIRLSVHDKSIGNINIELKPKSINTLIYDIGSQ